LLNTAPTSSIQGAATPTRRRRALIIADASAEVLREQLADSGYEVRTATTDIAPQLIGDFAPDVVIIELPRGSAAGVENDRIALARRLRAEPATYALSLIFVFSEDERAMRNTALNIGADDYFGLWTPHEQILARLDSLFWRMEAGRRAVSAVGDQRLEIDNFMLTLDSVRDDMRAGAYGTLALVYAVSAHEGHEAMDKAERDRTLAEAHGFLKLHLRRVDSVAFYGPTSLLVYLPRMKSETASDSLLRLRDEFLARSTESDIAIGLASFPLDGDDVESLIEKAEASISIARAGSTTRRVVAYEAKKGTDIAHPVQMPSIPSPSIASESSAAKKPEVTAKQPTARVWTFESQVVREKKVEDEVETVAAVTPVKTSGMQSNGADAARAAADAAARERERRASGAIMPRRLLLTISDAARMAQLNSLIRSAGYEARAAFDGQQALDLLRIERPDLLLLDYQLHGMDGLETLRRLRKQGGGRLILPVVLLLPTGNERVRAEALELGARSVVTTPYDPTDLLTSVRVAGSVE
jgi:DNA-binding response OmpR family regulator